MPCSCTWSRPLRDRSQRRWPRPRRTPACCSGTRTGTQAARCASRPGSPTSCSASTARLPAPLAEGAGDRARDRRAIDLRRRPPPPRRAAAAARPRPDRALEGLRHDARGVQRQFAGGFDAQLEIRGPSADRRRARAPRRAGERSPLAGAPRPRPDRAAAAARQSRRCCGRRRRLSATQPRGSATLDKVVYEAAACARAGGDDQRGAGAVPRRSAAASSRSRRATPTALAERLRRRRRGRRSELRAETGWSFAAASSRDHSLEHWADAVTATVAAGRE